MSHSNTEFEEKRLSKIQEIKDHTFLAKRNRALLSYKYDTLKFRMNIIQVLIIIVSTMITFLEAIKTHYNFNETEFNVATISMSTIIAFTMAIYRFFRIEENKENIKQSLESHVFIINKLLKTIHSMENFKLTDANKDEWYQLQQTYDTETFDNFISIKEKFDTVFSFQDSIYYKRKYKRDFLELQFTNQEISLVQQEVDNVKHSEFVLRLKGCLYYLMCCYKRERVDYTTFMKKAEEGKLRKINQTSSTQTEFKNEGTQFPSPKSAVSVVSETTETPTTSIPPTSPPIETETSNSNVNLKILESVSI